MVEASEVARGVGSEVRWTGVVCCIAGLVGATASIYLGLVSPSARGDGLTFPHGASDFLGLQMIIALSHVGLIFGLLGLWWSGVVPDTRGARVGHVAAMVIVAVLTPTHGVAVSVPMSPLDGTPSALSVAFVGFAFLLGVALLVEGAGVLHNAVWLSWMRWLPLSLGIWLLASWHQRSWSASMLAAWLRRDGYYCPAWWASSDAIRPRRPYGTPP